MPRRRLRLLLTAAVMSAGLTGCSSSIERGELETQAAAALETRIGVRPEVTCEDDLRAEVDATTECVAVAPGADEEVPIKITVTSVEDGRAEFEVAAVD